MRQKLVFFALACLVALPLAAASNVQAPNQTAAPAPIATAQQATTPAATAAPATSFPLRWSPPVTQAVGQCSTDADCTNYCLELYGSPYGACVRFRCLCIL